VELTQLYTKTKPIKMFFRDFTTVAGPILVVLFFMATQSRCDR